MAHRTTVEDVLLWIKDESRKGKKTISYSDKPNQTVITEPETSKKHPSKYTKKIDETIGGCSIDDPIDGSKNS